MGLLGILVTYQTNTSLVSRMYSTPIDHLRNYVDRIMGHVMKHHRCQNILRIMCNMEEVHSILSLQEPASQNELEEKLK